MIYEKALMPPSYRRRSVRREIALFSERSGALTARGLHFMPQGTDLVCAEGAEETERPVPRGANGLIGAEGHSGALAFRIPGGIALGGVSYALPEVRAVVRFRPEEGPVRTFAVTEDGVYGLGDSAVKAEDCAGGTCAAVHYERIFTAAGDRVNWSEPLSPDVWTHAEQGAGSLDLPSGGGEILSAVSFRERLYLFRERGISRLTALGDTTEFRAETLPFPPGTLQKDSVRLCGKRILFCTESGIFSFDGTDCTRLKGCGFGEIDLSAGISSASARGNYYAAVTLREGERCIWCVLPEEGTGCFLRYPAEAVAGGEELLFLASGKLFRLCGRDMPAEGRRECILKTERSLLGLSSCEKFLDGVTLEGRGRFRVEARGESGPPSAISGRAGERLVFPRPVRGNAFSLDLRTIETGARLSAVTFDLREEERAW